MNAENFAKVYILDAPYGADHGYHYFVPVEMLPSVRVGALSLCRSAEETESG